MKTLIASLILALSFVVSPHLATPAVAQPCQWRYSMEPVNPDNPNAGTATATYCGDVVVQGAFSGKGIINITSAANIAAMQNLPSPFSGQTVSVAGPRGGIFVWTEGALPCNPVTGGGDGGTTFCSIADAVYLETGFWQRQYSGSRYITWWNVYGNGITDNTTAIQQALSTLPAGSTLTFPAVDVCYRITASLSITSSVNLLGPGSICVTQADITAINISASNVSIDGLSISGPQSAEYADAEQAIVASGTFNAGSAPTFITNITLKNLNIHNFGGFGIKLDYVDNFSLSGNTISNIGYTAIGTASAINGVVSENIIDTVTSNNLPSNNAYGIYISRYTDDAGELLSNPRSHNIVINNNVVRNVPTWECYDTHGGENLVFSGNSGYGCWIGIAIGTSTNSTGAYTYAPINVSVTGNSVYSNVSDGSAAYGISFTGVTSGQNGTGTISGNVISGFGSQTVPTSAAVNVYNVSGLSIAGNSILYPSPSCFYLGQNVIATVISGNSCVDPWTNAAGVGQALGINHQSTGSSIFITGNSFRHADKSATYLLTTYDGTAIRLSASSGNSVAIGTIDSNAITLIYDPNLITKNVNPASLSSMPNLPTSCSGKPSKTLWNDSSTVKICP